MILLTLGRLVAFYKVEHPPAIHDALALCKRGYINQLTKFASFRFQSIAGRSNIERSASNVEKRKILTISLGSFRIHEEINSQF